MKNIILPLLSLCACCLASCLKDKPAVDFSTVGTIVEILPVNGGGLENFDAAELSFDGTEEVDSAAIVLNIASPKPLNKSLSVTLAVDDALRTAYNSGNPDQYDALPDSVYALPVNVGIIAAGQRLDTLHVIFYPSKIDVTKNYMLPVSIKDAGGETISGNFGSIYFHLNAQ